MFELLPMPAPIDDALLDRARQAEPATIGHFRLLGFPDPAIRPLGRHERIVGTAVTLALAGADSTLLHHSAGLLRPGDVLVIDRLGDHRHAALGGGVASVMARVGIAGIVLDGPCADPDEILECGLPIWCRGVSALTTRIYGNTGAMNRPVNVGGAVVHPGDLVIADSGGVVILPPDEAETAIAKAVGLQEWERGKLPDITLGRQLGELSGASALVAAKSQPTT